MITQGMPKSHKKPHNGETKTGEFVTVCGKGSLNRPWQNYTTWNIAMMIGWLPYKELTQSIPWIYTLFIGWQIMEFLKAKKDRWSK